MGTTEEELEKSTETFTEEQVEESKEEVEEEAKEKHKISVKHIAIAICSLIGIYLGLVLYFTSHFYFGSEVNTISISGKTMAGAKLAVASQLQQYTLNIKERAGKIEQIKGSDVMLKYKSDEEFSRLKAMQNPFGWVIAPFTSKNSKATVGLIFDEQLLKAQIDKLSCFDSINIVEPSNPCFRYTDGSYVTVAEVPGTRVNKELLYSRVVEALAKSGSIIDLESAGCYINPQYNSKSLKITEVKDLLNKYAAAKITYNFGTDKVVVDGDIINNWISVNENYDISINEEKVEGYLKNLSKTYNTIGKIRNFTGSSGKTISISGGDFGWSINIAKEAQNLITDIKEGRHVEKEPVYSQTAFSHGYNDIGNTYVEIDMDKQHLWCYKNGLLVVQGDIVTGDVRNRRETPKGIYRVKYKQRDAVLRGPGYEAPVTFWMPFNGGIGLHDATWRSVFGRNIYKTNGSHGCVNLPYNIAKTIFNNIEANTPVICY